MPTEELNVPLMTPAEDKLKPPGKLDPDALVTALMDAEDYWPGDGEEAFYAALEFWSALHGFVLLEMTGVMDDIDTDAVFSDMVLRLAVGMDKRTTREGAQPG